MKSKIRLGVTALTLMIGSLVGVQAEPASAHHHDYLSIYSCLGWRPWHAIIREGHPEDLPHTHPIELGAGYVVYRCVAKFSLVCPSVVQWDVFVSEAIVLGPDNVQCWD